MTARKNMAAVVSVCLLAALSGVVQAGPIEDPGGILYHLDAALGITLNGGNVATWADQGLLGNDFTQTNAARQPLWVASSINSLPAVQFSGSDQELLLSTATQPQTFIAVTTALTGGGLRGIWGGENQDKGIRLNNDTNYRGPGQNTDGNDFANGDANGVRVNGAITTAYAVGTPHIIAETRGPNFSATTFNTTSIGEYFADNRDYHGDVAEMVVYDRILRPHEIIAIENYLGTKYNITTAGQQPPPGPPGWIIGGLLGGDLTDPENDGVEANYNPPADLGGFDAIFSSTDEPGFGGGEYSFNVFDNQVGGGNNKWCCNDPGADGHQLDAEIVAGQHILTHFTLTSSNDSPGRDPSVFSIEGSNDGVNFEEIFSYDGALGALWTARDQTRLFEAGVDYPTPSPYSIFRYNVLDTVSGGHALSEIEYFGTPGIIIPEPCTLVLAGLAVCGLGGYIRRRKKA